jgi:hypothetical protein
MSGMDHLSLLLCWAYLGLLRDRMAQVQSLVHQECTTRGLHNNCVCGDEGRTVICFDAHLRETGHMGGCTNVPPHQCCLVPSGLAML